ncbi:hypothetical protein BH11PLA1_BH11PLA1_17650 [soil metagenome]
MPGRGGNNSPPPGSLHIFSEEQPGDQIGPYHLLERIGEGGFGVVWLAERRRPFVQRVALKLLKPGMDSKAVVARFEQERQALAFMSHPNVAKVFDGGLTGRGRPYFAMEYVRGEPITTFCNRNNLSIRERLRLMILTCEAVQHAHQKNIIHRDIKPSNVLVAYAENAGAPTTGGTAASAGEHERTDRYVLKVIDFGVAKAVNHTMASDPIHTELGQVIGTLEYMSPEQAERSPLDVDTRTDVYSLGVLMYELLTGTVPFEESYLRQKGYEEAQRIIREVDPPTPSTRMVATSERARLVSRAMQLDPEQLRRTLADELEWLPMHAMRKLRQERYDSAAAFALQINKYLRGEPLDIAPDSRWYRLKKLMRRHRRLVAAGATVMAALVIGLAATSLMLQRAVRAEARIAAALAAERQAGYDANIAAAGALLEHGNTAEMGARLEKCPAELRGWEWRFLNAAANSETRRVDLSEPIEELQFEPGDEAVWVRTAGRVVRIPSRAGQPITTLSARLPGTYVGMSAGHRLLILSEDKRVTIRSVDDSSKIVMEMAISPDDRIWRRYSISPDGLQTAVVCGAPGSSAFSLQIFGSQAPSAPTTIERLQVFYWDSTQPGWGWACVDNNSEDLSQSLLHIRCNSGAIESSVPVIGGREYSSGSFGVTTREPPFLLMSSYGTLTTDGHFSLAEISRSVSGAGRWATRAENGIITVSASGENSTLVRWCGVALPSATAVAQSGKWVAAAGNNGVVHLWDTGTKISEIDPEGVSWPWGVHDIRFRRDPDGVEPVLLAHFDGKRCSGMDIQRRQVAAPPVRSSPPSDCYSFGRQGADNTLRVRLAQGESIEWSTEEVPGTGAILRFVSREGASRDVYSFPVPYRPCAAARKSVCVFGAGAEVVCFWNGGSAKPEVMEVSGRGVNALAVTPDFQHILAATLDGKMYSLSRGGTGCVMFEGGHISAINCVAVSMDGTRALSGSSDGKIVVWDIQRRIALLATSTDGPVVELAFSPDDSGDIIYTDGGSLRWLRGTPVGTATTESY